MVAFETLLLGLVMRVQPVRLMVAPPVTAVVLRLDGATVARLRRPPWETAVDFGTRPRPHFLEAIGLDTEEREVSRASQWVNMPRADSEARLLLERDPGSGVPTAARVTWEDVQAADPVEVRAGLDGTPLAVLDGGARVILPRVDPASIHVLTVEVEFPEQRLARTDVAFGGDLTGAVQTELTAVPLTRDDPRVLPTAASLAGRFSVAGRPVRIVAVEEPPAEVVVVTTVSVMQHLPAGLFAAESNWRRIVPVSARTKDDQLFVISTVPYARLSRRSGVHWLFPATPPYRFSAATMGSTLVRLMLPTGPSDEETVGQAVAVGGLHAAAGNRRRVVVLLAGAQPRDDPAVDINGVKGFLADLRVPLRGWSLDRVAEPELRLQWGEVEDVSGIQRFGRAAGRLADDLERQVIVWLDGALLPQQISFAGAPGLQPAR
jgi:hypothetical protein